MIKANNLIQELSWNYRSSSNIFLTQRDWNQTLVTKLNQASLAIRRSMQSRVIDTEDSLYKNPMFIKTTSKVMKVIESLAYFDFNQEGENMYIGISEAEKRYVVLIDDSINGDKIIVCINKDINPGDHYVIIDVLNLESHEINRTFDDDIINLVSSILSKGDFIVETYNESVLCKLMELRGTPINVYKSLRNSDVDFKNWLVDNKG